MYGAVKDELAVIPGNVPNLIDLPQGCRFAPRCLTRVEESIPNSLELHPELRGVGTDHDVRCWRYHAVDGTLLPRPAGDRQSSVAPDPAPAAGLDATPVEAATA